MSEPIVAHVTMDKPTMIAALKACHRRVHNMTRVFTVIMVTLVLTAWWIADPESLSESYLTPTII